MANIAIETIENKLAEIFKEMDDVVIEKSKEWARGRVAAIREFQESDEGKALRRMGQEPYYFKLFSLAGGKSWFNTFHGRSAEMIDELMEKNHARTIASRNASITNKLVKADVTEVVESTYARTNDGFNGTFVVETNKGRKTVTIETIYAGGYNIQCLHLRVLVKVK